MGPAPKARKEVGWAENNVGAKASTMLWSDMAVETPRLLPVLSIDDHLVLVAI